MAGTLTVQNIEGPSSGSDANKVIIPSGQTLDVSGGTLVPSAGQVVQLVTAQDGSNDNVTVASTWVHIGCCDISITPKLSGSRLVYSTQYGVEFDASTFSGNNFTKVYYRVAGGSFTAHTNALYAPNGDNTAAGQQMGTASLSHTPSYTLGDTIDYRLYFYQTDSGSTHFNQQLGSAPDSTYVFNQVMEIAQ